MRPVVVVLVLGGLASAGCSGQETPDSAVVDDTPTARLDESGVVTCAEPSLRASGHFERKQAPEQPIPAAYLAGGGLVVEDLDGDGHLDLFLPSEHSVQLWYGRGDGGFDELAASALAGVDLSMAVGGSQVDYDGDGDLDLFVTRWELPNVLLRNEGGRSFTDVTASTGLGAYAWRSQSASWGDMDADGDLDLFVGSYGEWTILDVNETQADCSDHVAHPAELWRNEGDGTFTDLSDTLPVEVHDGYSFASGWYDLDADGYPELVSAHDDGGCAPSVLLDNDGTTLTVDEGSGITRGAKHDMGMGVADLNGDELPDFLFTSWKEVSLLQSGPPLELPDVPPAANGVFYVEHAQSRGLALKTELGTAQQVYGWGAEFGDVDNDADLDAVMVFGYWSTYTGAGDPLKQYDGLWLQDEAGQFDNQGPAAEWRVNDSGIGRGVVFADLNEDGWLDLVKRELDGPTLQYVSRCGAESWVKVRLQAPPPNTWAVGAKVRVVAGDRTHVRWVGSGSSGLYSGAPLEVHVGLGSIEQIDRLEVVWPDMRVSAFEDVAARQVLTVTRTE